MAFSCKGRALCPSCGVRRMADGIAHLVNCVLPRVPVRQRVLSLPHNVRLALAFNAPLCSKVMTIFIRAVRQHQRHLAKVTFGLTTVRVPTPGRSPPSAILKRPEPQPALPCPLFGWGGGRGGGASWGSTATAKPPARLHKMSRPYEQPAPRLR